MIVCLMSLSLHACSEISSHSGWNISTEIKEPDSKFRNYRSGHLLKKGDGMILEVEWGSMPNPFVTDTERCYRAIVEIPADKIGDLPVDLENTAAYFKSCNCVWGACTEEAATESHVTVHAVSDAGVQGRVSLRFPSTSVREAGFFPAQEPFWHLWWDDEAVKQLLEGVRREYEEGQSKSNSKE